MECYSELSEVMGCKQQWAVPCPYGVDFLEGRLTYNKQQTEVYDVVGGKLQRK
jgi:hypothetical protein